MVIQSIITKLQIEHMQSLSVKGNKQFNFSQNYLKQQPKNIHFRLHISSPCCSPKQDCVSSVSSGQTQLLQHPTSTLSCALHLPETLEIIKLLLMLLGRNSTLCRERYTMTEVQLKYLEGSIIHIK